MKALRDILTVESPDATLDRAALDLACIEHPGLDPEPWVRELDRHASEIADRAGDLSDGRRFLEVANRYLFEEVGFHGNQTHYYDPRNSCLNDVLAYKTGLPISLALVYMEIGRRLAKPIFGIGAPGHFLIQYNDGGLSVYMDAFSRGRLLSRDQCLAMVREYTHAEAADHLLLPVTRKQLLVRMLRNLEGAYVRQNDFERALQAADLLRLAGESRQDFRRGSPEAFS